MSLTPFPCTSGVLNHNPNSLPCIPKTKARHIYRSALTASIAPATAMPTPVGYDPDAPPEDEELAELEEAPEEADPVVEVDDFALLELLLVAEVLEAEEAPELRDEEADAVPTRAVVLGDEEAEEALEEAVAASRSDKVKMCVEK